MKKLIYLIVVTVALGLLIVAGCLPVVPPAEQNESVVSPNKDIGDSGEVWNQTTSTQYFTIQAAITAASPGNTIIVGAGIYNESLNIGKSISIVGVGSDQVFITGGIQITGGNYSGLTLEGLCLTGDASGPKNSVIDSRPTTNPVSDITIRNCVLDGEDTSGRGAFYGHYIMGTWTWEGNEIKNFTSWYVIDNTGSTNDVPYKLSHVVFADNDIHDVAGSIAFRGKIGEEIETAVISGNTIDYSMITTSESQCWAAVEVNNVLYLQVFNNTVTGVPEASWGDEGEAFQFWSVSPWTVDIHDNVITNNYMGIWFCGYLEYLSGYPLYVPSGSINNNNISGNTQFGLWISDAPPGSATSSAISGPLDAIRNWWGSPTGPNRELPNGKWVGKGDKVGSNIDYKPWSPQPVEFCDDLSLTCTTIQDGILLRSDGVLITTGYDEWGYDYQAHMFNGYYCDSYRDAEWCQPWRDVRLMMCWNDAWLSNMDCDGDGLLDRHYGYESYSGSGAWLTNHQSGEYEVNGEICKWNYFVKIVAAPLDAYTSGGIWYAADGTEIGPVIWGAFAIVQQVENDPCADLHGAQYVSPCGPGLGKWEGEF